MKTLKFITKIFLYIVGLINIGISGMVYIPFVRFVFLFAILKPFFHPSELWGVFAVVIVSFLWVLGCGIVNAFFLGLNPNAFYRNFIIILSQFLFYPLVFISFFIYDSNLKDSLMVLSFYIAIFLIPSAISAFNPILRLVQKLIPSKLKSRECELLSEKSNSIE